MSRSFIKGDDQFLVHSIHKPTNNCKVWTRPTHLFHQYLVGMGLHTALRSCRFLYTPFLYLRKNIHLYIWFDLCMYIQINSPGVSLVVCPSKKTALWIHRLHEPIHDLQESPAAFSSGHPATIHTRVCQEALFTCWMKAGSHGGNLETSLELLLAISTRKSLRLKVVDSYTSAVHVDD